MTKSTLSSPPVEASDELVVAARVLARLARVAERACGEAGLSLPQYRLLVFVAKAPQRAGDLASRSAVSRPTLTSLVDGLERQELVRRVPVEGDRRGIQLELTEAGRATLAETESRLTHRLGDLVARSGADALIGALAAIGGTLDEDLDKALAEKERSG
jgi:DNA-binding MarR family transcriptional regulator